MKKVIVLLVVVIVILIGFNAYWIGSRQQIAYVDIGRLQDSYLLKKDLEEKARGKLMTLKNVLDSLQMVQRMQQGHGSYTALDTNVARLQYEFNRLYNASNTEISETLWKRLNPLMEAYGKSHRYDLIVGANGAGTVLYGDKGSDVTEDLIKYVNHDYLPGK